MGRPAAPRDAALPRVHSEAIRQCSEQAAWGIAPPERGSRQELTWDVTHRSGGAGPASPHGEGRQAGARMARQHAVGHHGPMDAGRARYGGGREGLISTAPWTPSTVEPSQQPLVPRRAAEPRALPRR